MPGIMAVVGQTEGYVGHETRPRCGLCKHNTSNDMFSQCKSVQKMATGKSDDQFIQPDNKLKLGPKSGKVRIGHDCVVTLHDAYTNDDMTIITDNTNT